MPVHDCSGRWYSAERCCDCPAGDGGGETQELCELVGRLEGLVARRRALASDIEALYAEAWNKGVNLVRLRKIVRLRHAKASAF